MIFESWLDEEARLEKERAEFWKNVRFHIGCIGGGLVLVTVFYVIVWIGTAFND